MNWLMTPSDCCLLLTPFIRSRDILSTVQVVKRVRVQHVKRAVMLEGRVIYSFGFT